MAAKVKALQMWCKQQCQGYRDVQVTNLTSSFKSGLAFCAIIHRYRPDLIDYDSLSKENVFDNNKLAFDVANDELGIAALLDAEDMVAMAVPDKLCIVTYVAQYANYFRDKPPDGGPDVKQKVAIKRHTPKENVEPVYVAKRPTPDKTVKQQTTAVAPSGSQTEATAKRNTFGDKCAMCGKKVYVLERHFEGTTLYHRRCIRGSQRTASFGRAGETSGQTPKEDCGTREKENQVPSNSSSALLTQVNGGPKPYALSREEDAGKRTDPVGTTGKSSLLTQLRGGPAPYRGEATTMPQKARQVDMQKTDWNKFLGASPPASRGGGNTRTVEKMDMDDDVPPPLPLSKVPPKKPPRVPQMTNSSTVTEMAQPAPVERFSRVTEELPKTGRKDREDTRKPALTKRPEKPAVLSGLLHSLANVRQGSAGINGPHGESRSTQITVIKTTTPVSKPDTKLPKDESHVVSTKLGQKTNSRTSPFESVQQNKQFKKSAVSGVTTKKTDSSEDLKSKIKAFERTKDGPEYEGRNVPSFCTSHKTNDHKSAPGITTTLQKATFSQPQSGLKSTSRPSTKGPTIIRPPTSILKNGSNSNHAKLPQPSSLDHSDSSDSQTTITSRSESHAKTNGSHSSPAVAGNNFSAFNINDSMELDTGKTSEKGEETGGSKPTWQVEVEARGGKIHRQQVPKHGKKESKLAVSGVSDLAGSETDWQKEAKRREMARGGKYEDPEKNHVHIIKVQPSKPSIVPEPLGSPGERVGSPAEHVGSSAEPMGSPAEHVGSPVEHVKLPTVRVGSPAEHGGLPAERVGSPTEPKTTQLKRGDVFYIKDKSDEDTSPMQPAEKPVESVSDGKTEWQREAERHKLNRLHKDKSVAPTPKPRNISKLSLQPSGGSTEVARAPSPSVIVDNPSRVRVKPNAVRTEWYVDVDKRKTTRNGVGTEKTTVEYTEVVIDNGPGRTEQPYVIGQENRVKYTDVNVTKKVIRPETRFSFNLHDFKPPADSEERAAAVKQPPARPPTLPSRKNRYAPLPPTIGRPPQITPKRIVNAEKRMSPLEICRQLRHIDIELRDLEAEGRELEMQIRSGTDDEMDTSEDLMVQWFGLINQRNELVRKEADLMYRKKQQELEGIHENVEYELRCLMDKSDQEKTASEKARERVLLQELLETVNMRNSIVDSMEEDRIRYIEEDQEIAEVLGMKSLGPEAPPPSKTGTNTQKPGKKQQKKNGLMKPVAAAR